MGFAATLVVATVAVGSAGAPAAARATASKGATYTGPVIAVGDSVLKEAQSAVKRALGPRAIVDGQISRQFPQGVDVMRGYLRTDPRPRAVVVALGTNGLFRPSDMDSMMGLLRKVPRVVLVNTKMPDPWQDTVNSEIASAVKHWKNVRLADWYRVASARPDLLYPDETHPDPGGARVYAKTIRQALDAK